MRQFCEGQDEPIIFNQEPAHAFYPSSMFHYSEPSFRPEKNFSMPVSCVTVALDLSHAIQFLSFHKLKSVHGLNTMTEIQGSIS